MNKLFCFGDDIGVMIPAEWEVYQEEGVATIYESAKGIGALQLSLYRKGERGRCVRRA
ncbi:hypothetical protein [Olivibacter sp. LS-1]|uniref:hypothetical protein n=1 Tax=Olivibacter sp. LS-1 TaxID=2592345 RepID=UPI00143DC5A0|nr:hypothetical protein [Olivibacter sp. LS-1]